MKTCVSSSKNQLESRLLKNAIKRYAPDRIYDARGCQPAEDLYPINPVRKVIKYQKKRMNTSHAQRHELKNRIK
jgi:hypothetical protein